MNNILMSNQFICLMYTGDTYSKYLLDFNDKDEITISTNKNSKLYSEYLNNDIHISFNGKLSVNGSKIDLKKKVTVDNVELTIYSNESTQFFDANVMLNQNYISIGNKPENDIEISVVRDPIIISIDTKGTLNLTKNNSTDIYIDHRLVTENQPVNYGDIIKIDDIEIIIRENLFIEIKSFNSEIKTSLIPVDGNPSEFYENYPIYHRSPRIIHKIPSKTIFIENPPSKSEPAKNQLARTVVPPLIMIAVAIVVSMISKNMMTMLMMGAMSVTTVSFAISTYFGDRKDRKIKDAKRIEDYNEYLQDKIVDIDTEKRETLRALQYHFPTFDQISNLIIKNDHRIYEKNKFQSDFLSFRLGTGDVEPSFKIEYSPKEFEKDDLSEKANEIKKTSGLVKNAPIATSLLIGAVGFVGSNKLVTNAVQNMLIQLAAFQSYRDVHFIAVFDERNLDNWNMFRWLPHFKSAQNNTLNFVYNEKTRDQILSSFYQIIKDREQQQKEQKESSENNFFTPQYVLIVENDELVLDHSIMEYLSKDISDLNISIIFIKDTSADLPEHVKTVIEIGDAEHGNILIENEQFVERKFTPDRITDYDKLAYTIRRLSAFQHEESLKNSIPESITFLNLYNVKKVNELNLGNRWQNNLPYKSLAVPLGVRGKDDIVNLDLHERAHGPHGLIAGTTGSGKSELIQSYITSLAINFHPDNVGFLLIDYKGGGMANLFNDLPHLLGTITNLDGAQSMRALASIKAELEKRQTLFNKFNINHINQYQKLYNEGTATEAMPHLFLISDEFAELKSEQPDFMQELVSTARIGRSLGIHLILATQKPSGVVNEQIWSNSRFKISLKVQDKSDSNEILHTPDAASIVEPGRAYLQVGNNEIYELFQSAYSGGEYSPDNTEEVEFEPIYLINELGQYEVLTDDLSGLSRKDTKEESTQSISELDAVIQYISEYSVENNINRLPRPWLPPIPGKIYYSDYISSEYSDNWTQPLDLKVPIGVIDYPDRQAQDTLYLDLNEDKHIAIFSSPGFGKSNFIHTFITGLARNNSPEDINFYLLDFGANGLLPLRDLPHVADLVRIDETEKLMKFMKIITVEIDRRKKELSSAGVGTIDQYMSATGNKMPIIEIAIDTIDAAKEATWAEDFNSLIDQITREGANIGVYLIISANRHSAIRMNISANIKTQISLFLIDDSEVTDIVGRSDLSEEEMPGRGLIKLDQVRQFQTLLPNKADDDLERLSEIRSEADEMRDNWNGVLPDPIPMIPDDLNLDTYFEMTHLSERLQNHQLPIGLDQESTRPLSYSLENDRFFVILNDTEEQFINFDRLLKSEFESINESSTDTEVLVLNNDFDSEKIEPLINSLITNIDENISVEKQTIIYVEDLESFITQSNISTDDFIKLTRDAKDINIHFIFNTYLSYLNSNYDEIPTYVKNNVKHGIIGSRMTDQNIIQTQYLQREDYVNEDEGYFFKNRSFDRIKIPKYGQ